jgi:predicted histone-like DNA-binding protein
MFHLPQGGITMSFSYKVRERKNPQDLQAAPKFYAQVVYTGKKDLKALAERIAFSSTMSEADIYGVLIALNHEIGEALKEGSIVELGDLCSFYPALQSAGSDTAEDFLATTHVKRKGVRVRASHSLSAKLAEVSLKKLNGTNGG